MKLELKWDSSSYRRVAIDTRTLHSRNQAFPAQGICRIALL
jgi:hypothetical protein